MPSISNKLLLACPSLIQQFVVNRCELYQIRLYPLHSQMMADKLLDQLRTQLTNTIWYVNSPIASISSADGRYLKF